MYKKKFQDRLSILLSLTIILFVAGDFLRKFAIFFNFDFIRYTAVTKVIVLLAYFLFVLVFLKSYYLGAKTKRLLFLIVLLLLAFTFGQYFLVDFSGFFDISYKNFLILSRYLFWPVTLLVFFPLLGNKEVLKKHFLILEKVFIFNCLVILIAAFFKIDFFKTYSNVFRFGYMGFFNSHNQCSYYLILFTLYYYNAHYNIKWKLKLVLCLITCFLVGTKKLYLFVLILMVYHIISNKLWRKRLFYPVSLTFITFILSFFYFLQDFILDKFKALVGVYNSEGIITAIFSFRDKLLFQTFQDTIIDNWTLLNFISGGPRFHSSRVELGFVDLYMFFGVFGFYCFYFLFKIYYEFSNHNKFYAFVIFTVLLLECLAGGFLSDPNIPLIFFIISGFMVYNKQIVVN
jgi:hypothetical protein